MGGRGQRQRRSLVPPRWGCTDRRTASPPCTAGALLRRGEPPTGPERQLLQRVRFNLEAAAAALPPHALAPATAVARSHLLSSLMGVPADGENHDGATEAAAAQQQQQQQQQQEEAERAALGGALDLGGSYAQHQQQQEQQGGGQPRSSSEPLPLGDQWLQHLHQQQQQPFDAGQGWDAAATAAVAGWEGAHPSPAAAPWPSSHSEPPPTSASAVAATRLELLRTHAQLGVLPPPLPSHHPNGGSTGEGAALAAGAAAALAAAVQQQQLGQSQGVAGEGGQEAAVQEHLTQGLAHQARELAAHCPDPGARASLLARVSAGMSEAQRARLASLPGEVQQYVLQSRLLKALRAQQLQQQQQGAGAGDAHALAAAAAAYQQQAFGVGGGSQGLAPPAGGSGGLPPLIAAHLQQQQQQQQARSASGGTPPPPLLPTPHGWPPLGGGGGGGQGHGGPLSPTASASVEAQLAAAAGVGGPPFLPTPRGLHSREQWLAHVARLQSIQSEYAARQHLHHHMHHQQQQSGGGAPTPPH